MKFVRRFKGGRRRRTVAVATAVTLLWVSVSSAGPLQLTIPQSFDKVRMKVSFGVGYFTPSRSAMRDLYGDAVNTVGAIEYRLHNKFFAGVFGGYIEQDELSPLYLKFRNPHLGPTVTYLIKEGSRYQFYGQVAAGLNFRKVTTLKLLAEQEDFGVSSHLTLGFDYLVKAPVYVGAKVTYDYTFDSDPTLGAFGNTGGFNLVLVVGGAL